jgi:hypothetical protein
MICLGLDKGECDRVEWFLLLIKREKSEYNRLNDSRECMPVFKRRLQRISACLSSISWV